MHRATVSIVDDDEFVRHSLTRVLAAAGWRTHAYASGMEFLNAYSVDEPGCILLDIRLPDRSGLELQADLDKMGCVTPIIFLTGHGDIEMGVEAMKAGAADFITKPWEKDRLLDAIQQAVKADRDARRSKAETRRIQQAYDRLTPREQEVCQLVVTGLLNKQVADRLGVTEKTVKVHRGRVMQKMEVESLAKLVHLVEQLGLGLAHS